MFRLLYSPYLLTLLLLSTIHSLAHQSCSIIDSSYPFPPDQHAAILSQGCTFQTKDTFTISVLLPAEGQTVHVSLSSLGNSTDSTSFELSRRENQAIEVLQTGQLSSYVISDSTETLILSIRKGIVSVIVDSDTTKVMGELKGSISYTLTIQTNTMQKAFLHHHQPVLRILDQCPSRTYLINQLCLRVCPVNTYGEGGVCNRCSEACPDGKCLSSTRCNVCKEDEVYSEVTDSCVAKCPDFYFEDYNNRLCVKCMDGCISCSFPNGICTLNYFKTDMMINLAISGILFVLIVICACLCNKDTQEESEKPLAKDVKQNTAENAKTEVKKQLKDKEQPAQGPYNVLNEENDPVTSEREVASPPRLSEYAKTKLLNLSLARKPFVVDDGNDERAVSHDSASKILPKSTSATLPRSKLDISPMLSSKGGIDAFKLSGHNNSNCITPGHKPSMFSIEESMVKAKFDWSSPVVAHLMLRKQSSLGLYGKKVMDSDNEKKVSPLVAPQEEEEDDTDKHRKEGYRSDASYGSVSRDQEGMVKFSSCSICNMNKKDCMNKPCGHIVACYACMKQFKKNYGVCPECKKQVESLEKGVFSKIDELVAQCKAK